MIELLFLNTIQTHLLNSVESLKKIGYISSDATNLPGLSLALENCSRDTSITASGTIQITNGALPWHCSIDCSAPFIDGDTSFSLISNDRKELILPFGDLVKKDGGRLPLESSDITIALNDTLFNIVTNNTPANNEAYIDPRQGKIFLGSPLPPRGTIDVNFYLGQFQRSMYKIKGALLLKLFTSNAEDIEQLHNEVLAELFMDDGRCKVSGFEALEIRSLGQIESIELQDKEIFTQEMQLPFTYTGTIDKPDSSGGIIEKVVLSGINVPA